MVNKPDYLDWKNLEVTKTLFKDLTEAAEASASEILTRETFNSDRDMLLKGYLKAIDNVISWRPEFKEDQNEG
jgi:hypothetical protein